MAEKHLWKWNGRVANATAQTVCDKSFFLQNYAEKANTCKNRSANQCENPHCQSREDNAAKTATAVAHCEDCHNFLCARCFDSCTLINVEYDITGDDNVSSRQFRVPICPTCAEKRINTKKAEIAELLGDIKDEEEELFRVEQKLSRLEEEQYESEKDLAEYKVALARAKAELSSVFERKKD